MKASFLWLFLAIEVLAVCSERNTDKRNLTEEVFNAL